jgi:hypothetical protein
MGVLYRMRAAATTFSRRFAVARLAVAAAATVVAVNV